MEFLSTSLIVMFKMMTHDVNMAYKIIEIVNNDIKINLKLKILNSFQMGV